MAEPLARSGEPNHLPGGRLSSLTSRRYRAPSSHVSSHVSSGRASRPPGRRVRAPALGPDRARRERSEPRRQHRPKVGYDVVRAASERRREERSDDRVIRFVLLARRVGLVVRLVLGSAPLSEQGARSRSDGSRVELAPRAPRDEPSTARSARRRQRATRASAHPHVARQRPMSGCAAIGLALGRIARAQSCGRPKDQEDDRPTTLPGATSRMTRSSLRSSLHRFGSGATASYPP